MPMSREGSNGWLARSDPHFAGLVRVKTGENFQKRRLSATGRADKRDQFAGFDVERRFGDRQKFRPAGAIDLLHASKMDERLGHCALIPSRASRTTSRRSRPRTIR